MKIGRRGVLVGTAAAVIAACSRRDIFTGAPTDTPSVDPGTAAPLATTEPTPTATPTAAATTEATTEATSTTAPTEPADVVAAPVTASLLCREAWGAAPAGPDELRHTPTRITVHHTAAILTDNREAPRRWRGYQRFHQDQGWSDIAYHVGVDRGGNLYELRNPDIPGDTFTDYDPAGHHLIVADGNFEDQEPTPEQVEAIAQAAAAAAVAYGIDPATIGGHRDHASTSCPGGALYGLLPAIRERAAQLVAGGVSSAITCGPEADARITSIEAGA